MNVLELFEHRYNKGQKFSWLEMIDFAEAYASQPPKAEEEEIIHILKPKYLSKDGSIKDGFQVDNKWYAPKNDLPQAPKAVTDGEIEEAFPLEIPRVMFKPSREYNKAQECRREGAKWMREQQGEGARERYEKAVAQLSNYGISFMDLTTRMQSVILTASGFNSKIENEEVKVVEWNKMNPNSALPGSEHYLKGLTDKQ